MSFALLILILLVVVLVIHFNFVPILLLVITIVLEAVGEYLWWHQDDTCCSEESGSSCPMSQHLRLQRLPHTLLQSAGVNYIATECNCYAVSSKLFAMKPAAPATMDNIWHCTVLTCWWRARCLLALVLALVALVALFALVLPQIALLVPALEIKLTTLEPALHPAGGDWEESKQNSALMPDYFADFNKRLMG